MPVSIHSLGDNAITVSFGNSIDIEINSKVVSLANYFNEASIPAVKDVIPAYASLTIVYDVLKVKEHYEGIAFDKMKTEIDKALQYVSNSPVCPTKTLHIPVCYDVSLGLDLLKMATDKQMSVEEIVRCHSAKTYRVFMIGFLPGFAYMGTVDDKIATPRKRTPRQQIPAGSIGIADSQTGIYPFNSPGGWNIIGQTPEPIFYPHLAQPCLFTPGDEVQFIPISLDEFKKLKA